MHVISTVTESCARLELSSCPQILGLSLREVRLAERDAHRLLYEYLHGPAQVTSLGCLRDNMFVMFIKMCQRVIVTLCSSKVCLMG